MMIDIILFNDGHVLHLRSETVAIHRQMNMVSDDYDGQMIPGDECGPNSWHCLTVRTALQNILYRPHIKQKIVILSDSKSAIEAIVDYTCKTIHSIEEIRSLMRTVKIRNKNLYYNGYHLMWELWVMNMQTNWLRKIFCLWCSDVGCLLVILPH